MYEAYDFKPGQRILTLDLQESYSMTSTYETTKKGGYNLVGQSVTNNIDASKITFCIVDWIKE